MLKKFFFLSLSLLLLGVSCDDDSTGSGNEIVEGGRVPDGYSGTITRILEDNVHATKQNTTYQLTETDFSYVHMYAFRRLFNHLNRYGYEHDRLVSGHLTPELLAQYDIVFINLMDTEKPDFTEEEISAVEEWVSEGGGLFLIADHTNVYRHAEKLNPLLEPYGITIRYEIAVDQPPHSVSGLGWILVTDLTDHPVNDGIHEYSLQTGGPIDGPGGTGFTSAMGWGDFWDETMTGGFYGNWTKDEGEQSGPQAVVQAVTHGLGKVFIAGDQNMFGDPYLWFIDNGGLALNAFEWLAHREDDDPPLRFHKAEGLNIHIDARADQLSMGKAGATNHYTFYVNMNRVEALTTHASRYPLYFEPDVCMVVEPAATSDATFLAEMDQVLADGGQAVVIVDPNTMSTASSTLLGHFGVDYQLEDLDGASVDLTVGSLNAPVLDMVTTNEDLRGAPRTLERCSPLQCPGHALVSAQDSSGQTCDLICEYPVSSGRLVLVFTGYHFRNGALGGEHVVPYTDHDNGIFTEANYFLQLGMTDLLLDY